MPATGEVQETATTDLGALLDAGNGAVVTLVAGETLLAAHRRVLATRSPVFADMLQCDSPESSSSSSSEVTVADVEGPILRQLLAYCYTLQPPQLPDMAAQLLAAADKFSLSGLKDACERQLLGQLAVENAAAVAVLALSHSCAALKQAAVTFIRAHLHQVMVTQGWADAMVSHPHSVVELTRLVAEPPAGAGTPAAPAEAGPTPATDQQPRSGHGSPNAATAAAAAAPAGGRHTPPPDDEAVSRYRSLSVEERDKRLLQAAEKGEVGELQALLTAGADIAARDEEGYTALHWAAIRGHVEAAKCLLQARADVGARCSQQYTPLHCAAMHGRSAVARLLLAAAADPNARAHGGWAPQHIAAWTGEAHMTEALLELGADDQARNNKGQTPLDIATETGHKRIVAMLTQR